MIFIVFSASLSAGLSGYFVTISSPFLSWFFHSMVIVDIFYLASPVFHSYNFVNMILLLSRGGEQVFLYRKVKLLFVK